MKRQALIAALGVASLAAATLPATAHTNYTSYPHPGTSTQDYWGHQWTEQQNAWNDWWQHYHPVTPSPIPVPSPTHSTTPTPSASPSSASVSPSAPPTSNGPTPTSSPSQSGAGPSGPGGTWNLKFSDDFDGSSVNTSLWSFQSTAESVWANGGTGNPNNQQLEWDQPQNCSVSNGALSITAKPGNVVVNGHQYNWTSCMINTSPSFSFQYGYMEMRAQFPAVKGFWPGFWTWAKPNSNSPASNWETDAEEVYTDNQLKVYQTQHNVSPAQGCIVSYVSGTAAGWHTYGVDIEPNGTTWYLDGKATCSKTATSGGPTNILLDNFVYSGVPPLAGSQGVMVVDYVKEWQH